MIEPKKQRQSKIGKNLKSVFEHSVEEEEVLCFYRENKSYGTTYRNIMNRLANKYLNIESFDTISEYKSSARLYIDLKKYSIADYSNDDLDIFHKVIDISEIRRKERIFRTHLNYYESYDLLISVTKFFIELFKTGTYKVLITQTVDNYVMYAMTRVAAYYDVKVLGVILFFYKDYIRITVEGEHNVMRAVEDEEVEEIYNRMLAKERSVFKMNKAHIYKQILYQFFSYKAKYVLHYLINYKLLDKREYEYIGTPGFKYPKQIKNFFPGRFFEEGLSKLTKFKKEQCVYIPMHFYPEATVEFWVDDPEISPYYPSLYEVAKRLSNDGFKVLIKEHPAFFFKRDITVYKKLKSIKNVFLIKPFISTYEVIDLVDYTVVWTGTSGVESIMQDKKVLIASENYYSNFELPRVGNIAQAKIFNETEKKALIKRILENCVKLKTT